MSLKPNNLKIGLFVLAGLAVLLASLFVFGARTYFEEKKQFETYVSGDVEGLSIGSAVLLRGVPVGKVNRITFTWIDYPALTNTGHVLVQFEVKARIIPTLRNQTFAELLKDHIARGLRARVKGVGITGTSILSLEYLTPPPPTPLEVTWEPAHHYIPSAETQFSQMVASIEASLRNLREVDFSKVSTNLNQVLRSTDKLVQEVTKLNFDRLGTEATRLIAEVRETNQKLQTNLLDQISGDSTKLLAELRASNQKLSATLDDARAGIHAVKFAEINASLNHAGRNADKLLLEVVETNRKLHTLLDRLNTLNVAPLNTSIENARSATESLDAVLRELKQYPSGFLFGTPPPPARSLQKPAK